MTTGATTAAQHEFNDLLRDKHRHPRHPSDTPSDPEEDEAENDPLAAADYLEKLDTDDELDYPARTMRTTTANNYYMPSLRSDANTGPKGVIADARAFELAKKQARRFTFRKTNKANAALQPSFNANAWDDARRSLDDESFIKEWRATRLKELQNVGQRIRSRTTSPSRRIYGTFLKVDPAGYLDALDKSGSETIVAVFVYDDINESQTSKTCREYMCQVAQWNDTTRFIRLADADADMVDKDALPAVLAYKKGEQVAMVLPLLKELHDEGSELSVISLETCFRKHGIL